MPLPFLSAKIRDGIKLSHLVGKGKFEGRGENAKTFATNKQKGRSLKGGANQNEIASQFLGQLVISLTCITKLIISGCSPNVFICIP